MYLKSRDIASLRPRKRAAASDLVWVLCHKSLARKGSERLKLSDGQRAACVSRAREEVK